jgi:hypothetical protein
MFNNDFYPTPKEVIETMLQGLDLYGKNVLEPSAGKGDIINYCKELGAKVYACEIDLQLKKFVKQSCDVFMTDDFLTLTKEDVSHMDYIIMNPPFSADEKHLLHAWDIAPNNCTIVCLINSETYHNDYSKDRQRLKRLINDYGDYDVLGDVFSQAERKTNVEIGLVRLYTPISEHEFESSYFDLTEEPEYAHQNGLVTYNEVHEIVNRYIAAIKVFDKQAQLALELNNALKGVYVKGDFILQIKDEEDVIQSKETFKINLQRSCWDWIFRKLKMEKYLTTNLQRTMNAFVERQKKVPFTVRNIYKVIELVVVTHHQRMEQAMVDIFDKITMHHKDNRYNREGWATNSHYLLREKFILEDTVYFSKWGSLDWGYNAELLNDFVKVLCFLTATNYDDINQPFKKGWSRGLDNKATNTWYSFGFFEIKFFKKGTGHIKFTNKDLCYRFNKEVARIKGYPLPESL